MTSILVFQNYFTPARHALFERLCKRGVALTALYMHLPSDEGRAWSPVEDPPYPAVQLPHFFVGKTLFFWVPMRFWRANIIVLDNNPSNICMILWSALFALCGSRLGMWVEHIPDRYKGRLKLAYQAACTRLLALLCPIRIAFSDMTRRYLEDYGIDRNLRRMVQAVPPPGKHAPARPPAPLRRFGYLGSDGPRKNVQALIEAFGGLGRDDVTLKIAGFTGEQEMPGLDFLGYVDEASREAFFQSIDVLILPSLADPWGFVINEALERGCLAVASERCGSAELVAKISPDLVCGITPAEIGTCLEKLIALDASELAALRAKVPDALAGYSMDAATNRFAGIARALAGGAS
ncbi:glycosyltransferase family 4 protein [Methyloligella sp. 2.7D]|uniref:glycosyltransferase family 4 protein n=1 Tax=unclassified Methyloligella TaxID=2625955 RepID=UPI00157C85AD|nr:glycosyltransferase family 4 protein [Methyloligella sp. GL2]QKP78194.1 glycosyltransferase family 4 protein [Methyloligella sp. GL2]